MFWMHFVKVLPLVAMAQHFYLKAQQHLLMVLVLSFLKFLEHLLMALIIVVLGFKVPNHLSSPLVIHQQLPMAPKHHL